MNCHESRELIFLMREGELTADESGRLRNHLRTCAECTALQTEAVQLMKHLNRIRSVEPALSDPETLTSEILSAAALEQQKRSHSGFPKNILNVFSTRPLRLVYSTFVLGAAALFVIQQLETAQSVDSLERRMMIRQGGRTGIQMEYAVPANIMNVFPRSREAQSYLYDTGAQQKNGTIVLNAGTIARAMDLVGDVVFRSLNIPSYETGRKSLETIMEQLQQATRVRVTINPKE